MSGEERRWNRYLVSLVSRELTRATRYCDALVQLSPLAHDPGLLLSQTQCREKSVATTIDELPAALAAGHYRGAVLLNGNLNYSLDIQGRIAELRARLGRGSRIIAVVYNPYLRWVYRLATAAGLREGPMPSTFVTVNVLAQLAALSGCEIVSIRTAGYCPWRLLGIGRLVNRVMTVIPLLRWLAFATIVVLRPVRQEQHLPSISIVVPARNEAGNIAACLERLPDFAGAEVEVIFVEGHSTDETWNEISRLVQGTPHRRVRALRQEGAGKNDAVRLGFRHASHDLVTILDADLTTPPEHLGKFYEAYCRGLGDFVNGNRLVYPMESGAMRFLNVVGNVMFAKLLSRILSLKIGDTLCGTKLLARRDVARLDQWRRDFGELDPFGDFDMLFAAAQLNLGVIDVPVHYRARAYGRTNINRFRDGWRLLSMSFTGFLRMRLGPG